MSFFRWARLSGYFILAIGLMSSTANADNLTTISGKKLTGKLVGVDGQGVALAVGTTAPVKVPAKEILLVDLGHAIAAAPKETKYQEIELTDGSTFRVAKFAIKGKKVAAELMTGPKGVSPPIFEIEMGNLFAVMRGADDAKNREAWKKLLANRGKRDLYVIREADGLNFVQGTIVQGNEAGDLLTFEKEDGSTTDLRLSRATGGLVFAQQPPMQIPPTLCKVYDVFGNVLIGQGVELAPSGVTIKTVSGVVVRYQNTDAIAKLDYGQGNIAYLSDLEAQIETAAAPADEKGLRTNVSAAIIRDVNVSNIPLKLGGETYSRGISVNRGTHLSYNLGGDYREFKGIVGLPDFDDRTADDGSSAQLTIETESGVVLFSEVLHRKDRPRPIALDVKGVKQLHISVGSDLPILDNRVILGEARVQK